MIQRQPGRADFVVAWLTEQGEGRELDPGILDLVRRHCRADGLDEEGLLQDLIVMSESEGAASDGD